MSDVVQKLWGFCHTLRHDGIGYTEYVEQLTYLLFLKMAHERGLDLPKKCDWEYLCSLSGTDLLDGYVDILRTLGRQPGLLGDIYTQAQSRFNKPTSLKQLIGRIDEIEWTTLGVDVKAAAYEGLLEKAASEGKKGAGQLFTPRVLIESMVRCMKPDPRTASQFMICDPACGTGGFLVSAYEWLMMEIAYVKSRRSFFARRFGCRCGPDVRVSRSCLCTGTREDGSRQRPAFALNRRTNARRKPASGRCGLFSFCGVGNFAKWARPDRFVRVPCEAHSSSARSAAAC
jgi:N-6 DNA Methylase/HsdM N-terminal domain